MTEANIRSAFHDTGAVTKDGLRRYQLGETKDPSDANAILSANTHYKNLKDGRGQRVLDSIPIFSSIVTKKDFIPEDDFPQHIGDADNNPPTKDGHMSLNDMATNRQRCCIYGGGFFQFRNELRERNEMITADKDTRKRFRNIDNDENKQVAKKAKVAIRCGNTICENEQNDKSVGWGKCSTKFCRLNFCENCVNDLFLERHIVICAKRAEAKKAVKEAVNDSALSGVKINTTTKKAKQN